MEAKLKNAINIFITRLTSTAFCSIEKLFDNMTSTKFENDEIDLLELFVSLWRGKWFILFCLLIAIIAASAYLRNADRRFTVNYIFQPTSKDDIAPTFSGLGGIASLAGITLPTSSSSDFSTYKFLIISEEVASILLKDKEIVKEVFKSEWDKNSNSFKKPELNMLGKVRKNLKIMLACQIGFRKISPLHRTGKLAFLR